jgi:putative Holliday junction resolvase
MRHLGIDFGTSKVGLALSDEAGTMGFPHEVLPNDERLMDTLIALVKEERVGAVVFGESLDFSGNGNPVLAKAHAFANALTEKTGVRIFWEQEMLTTQEAKRGLDGLHPQHVANTARSRSTPGNSASAVDASAAALILTSYLSRHDRA